MNLTLNIYMPTDILEDICDGSQSYSSINSIESLYKICDSFQSKASGMERSDIINAKHG